MKTGMCPNTSRQPPAHTQCIPVAIRDASGSAKPWGGLWPFPSTLHPREHGNTWMGLQQAGRCAEEAGGQTDRVWDGQALLAGTAVAELLLSALDSLAHPGFHLLSRMSLLPQPARVGLRCLWGRWRNSGSSERGGNGCAVNPKQWHTSEQTYITYSMSYIIYAHVHMEVLRGSSFRMTNIFCLHDSSFWLNTSLHTSKAGHPCHL